ncbi:MAG: glycosyltransferase family 4 protein [Kofleriaceae bacterium]|nr:glycosyltransferase family 4 protein [Kofleriaceae bacterium]
MIPSTILLAVTDARSALLVRGQLAFLRGRGHDVHLVSGPGGLARDVAASEGVSHHVVTLERALAPYADARATAALARLFRRLRPTLVDGSTPKAGLLALVAARLVGVPVRVHTLRGLRHTTLAPTMAAVTWAGHRVTCSLADRVICVSESLREQAIASRIVTARRAVVLGAGSGNGVDLGMFTPSAATAQAAARLRAALGLRPEQPVIGYVGRLARDKGVEDLILAWPRIADATGGHLLIAGAVDPTDPVPGAMLSRMEARRDVTLIGEIDEVAPAYLVMDVVVLPSRREGLNNVLLEAAAMERPTVTTAVPGCRDAIVDGVTGTLVPPARPCDLADAVVAYVRDPAARRAHGRAGRARVLRDFAAPDVHRRIAEEYERLIAAAGRHRGAHR